MTAIAETTPQESIWSPETVARREGQARRLTAKGYVGLAEAKPYKLRLEALKKYRTDIEPVWRDVRDYLLPPLGRYLDNDKKDADSDAYRVDFSRIYDSSPTKMAITAADGLHGGLTNQAEQWFSYYVGNYRDYDKTFSAEAKDWIVNAQECVRDTLAISNFYSAIHQFYLEQLGFGTALMLILSDPASRVRYYTKTAGTYWLGQDSRQRIDSVFIKYTARAEDIVKDYGEENSPRRVIEAVGDKRGDQRFNLIQCIQPWSYFKENGSHPEFRFEDVRFVESADDDEKILFRGGYRTKPFVAARWSDTGDSIYGRSSPAIEALPDIKQLHVMTLDINRAIKWLVDPAWINRSSTEIISIEPGKIYNVGSGDARLEQLSALVPPNFDLNAAMQNLQNLHDRVSATLYNREILLVQNRQRQITATEVNQLIAEKNAVLGPISARLGDNVLIPTLDRSFEVITDEWHILPDPPQEIGGLEIKPYFTGQLAKAQRQGGALQQIDYTLQIAERMTALQSPDTAYFNLGAMLVSANEIDIFLPGTIRTEQEVEEIKEVEARVVEEQQKMLAMQNALTMAKTAGDTSMAPDTLAGQIAGADGGEM